MSRKISKRAQQRKLNRPKIPVWPFIAGFVVVIAALAFIPKKEGVTTPGDEYSVVPVEVSYPAPELALENLDGGTQSLADFRGKVVLVNNWATWCPPCKAELPTLVAFYNEYASKGFVIIGIEAGEPASEVKKFVEYFEITYPVWLDPDNLSGRTFGVSGLPNSFVIDRDGTVRLSWLGQISRAVLEEYVTPILEE